MTAADQPADWNAADRAYLEHHFTCPTCCAAGASQAAHPRCPAGQALWEVYQSAGMPLHFRWLQSPQRHAPPPQAPPPSGASSLEPHHEDGQAL